MIFYFIGTLKKSYLPSDLHTNTVISDRFAYLRRWRWKPWLRLVFPLAVVKSKHCKIMVWHWLLFWCFVQDVSAGAWAFINWNINVSTRDSKNSTWNARSGKIARGVSRKRTPFSLRSSFYHNTQFYPDEFRFRFEPLGNNFNQETFILYGS